MAVAPLPWLVFGRGFPVSSAPRSASPAHGLAPRPAPCGGRGLPFLRGGLSFSFCSSFSPPAQGHFRGVPSIWARAVSKTTIFNNPPARRCRAGGVFSCHIIPSKDPSTAPHKPRAPPPSPLRYTLPFARRAGSTHAIHGLARRCPRAKLQFFFATSENIRIFAADFKTNTHEKQKPLPNNRESQRHIG